MTAIIVIATCVSAAATIVIAYHTVINHRIVLKIQSRDEEFRHAVILSSLISAAGTIDVNTLRRRIDLFKAGRPEVEKLFRFNEGG